MGEALDHSSANNIIISIYGVSIKYYWVREGEDNFAIDQQLKR